MQNSKARIVLAKPEDLKCFNLSVSKAKTFESCKAKYKFSYIDRLPKKDWDHLVFGKFLHEILEVFYKKRIDGDLATPNHLLLSSSWKHAFNNWKSKLSKEQITEAKTICEKFLFKIAKTKPQPTVLAVEKSFNVIIDEKILLVGFIDRVQLDHDGLLHVADYKTSKSKEYLKKDFFQLLTYAWVMCLEDPTLQKVRTSYIMLKHGFDSIEKEFERDEIMELEAKILNYYDQIDEERLFRPNTGPLCPYCDYADDSICPEGFKAAERYGKKPPEHTTFGKDTW